MNTGQIMPDPRKINYTQDFIDDFTKEELDK
jgi:hypothetical protein